MIIKTILFTVLFVLGSNTALAEKPDFAGKGKPDKASILEHRENMKTKSKEHIKNKFEKSNDSNEANKSKGKQEKPKHTEQKNNSKEKHRNREEKTHENKQGNTEKGKSFWKFWE